MDKLSYDGPIVLVVLDGVGLAPDSAGNAVSKARTPFLGKAARDYLHVALNASGKYVGLVPGQVGNSEIGHNTLGAGQIIKQDFLRVNEAFENGSVFETDAWKEAVKRATNGGTLHFSGIFRLSLMKFFAVSDFSIAMKSVVFMLPKKYSSVQ